MDVVPIKVKIGLRPNGEADHPDWSQLQFVQDWSIATGLHTDHFNPHKAGGGWQYDKTSGHQDETAGSPIGMQWALSLVDQTLAQQAVAEWPTLVVVLTEVEAESYWDNNAHGHEQETLRDEQTLQGLQAERALRIDMRMFTTAIDAEIEDALDPDSAKQGVIRNKRARWSTTKAKYGFTVVGLS